MLYKTLFDPANADTDGLADGLTGAGPWDSADFETTDVPDGLAHRLNLTSGDDLDEIDITITGLDADGREISEVVTGPDNGTVETTKYFKSISAVAADATLGANTLDIGWVDEFVSPTIPLDWRRNVPSRWFADQTGTITWSIDFAIEEPAFVEQAAMNWLNPNSSLAAETADSTAFQEVGPGYTAARLRVASYTDTAELLVYAVQPEVA
jgi:hypothetical protein